MKRIAVIDTETTYKNELMSIGVAIADADTYEMVCAEYYVLTPEYKNPSMFGSVLFFDDLKVNVLDRASAISSIKDLLDMCSVGSIFAYNAGFDKQLLTELSSYPWYDIMRIAAYRQYNASLGPNLSYCSSGRLKSGFGVEPIYKMLSGNCDYKEVHNAYYDALDELGIMRMLGLEISIYEEVRI